MALGQRHGEGQRQPARQPVRRLRGKHDLARPLVPEGGRHDLAGVREAGRPRDALLGADW